MNHCLLVHLSVSPSKQSVQLCARPRGFPVMKSSLYRRPSELSQKGVIRPQLSTYRWYLEVGSGGIKGAQYHLHLRLGLLDHRAQETEGSAQQQQQQQPVDKLPSVLGHTQN